MWQFKLQYILLFCIIIQYISANNDWPDSSLLELNNVPSPFKTLSVIDDNSLLDSFNLEATNPNPNLISILSATGGGPTENELQIICTAKSYELKWSLQQSVSLPIADYSLALTGIPTGTLTVAIGLDHGKFTIANIDGLTINSGTSIDSTSLTVSGNLAQINVALSSLVYSRADFSSGVATITIYISGYGIVSGSCQITINVIPITITAAISPLHVSVNLIPGPTINDFNTFASVFQGDLSVATGVQNRFVTDSVKGSETLTVFFTIEADSSVVVRRLLAAATPTDIFNQLTQLTPAQLTGTQYLKLADLNSWQQECPDGSWRMDCDSASNIMNWLFPVIIASSVLGFILIVLAVAITVKKCRNRNSEKDNNTPAENIAPAIGVAKQYIYTPPTAGAEYSTSDPKSVHFISEVAIQEKSSSIDPTHARGAKEEELFSEPVLVGEDEKAAAELAKSRMEQSKSENSNIGQTISVSSKPKLSGSSRHFFYVDESKPDNSTSSANSNSSILAQREESRRNSVGSTAHFRYSDDKDHNSVNSNSSHNDKHLPIIPPCTPVSKQGEQFKSVSCLDLDKSVKGISSSNSPHQISTTQEGRSDTSPEISKSSISSASNSPVFAVAATKEKKAPLKVVKPNNNEGVTQINNITQN